MKRETRKTPYQRKPRNQTARREERAEIYNSQEWKRLRKAYFQKNPLCERCLENGRVTAGEHVHHIHSFMNYDSQEQRMQCALDWNNLMTVCVECHNIIHNNTKGKKES